MGRHSTGAEYVSHDLPTDKRRVSGCLWSELRRLFPASVTWKWTAAPKPTSEPSVENSCELRGHFPQSRGSVGLVSEVCSQRLFSLNQDCRTDPVTSSPRFLQDPAPGCSRTQRDTDFCIILVLASTSSRCGCGSDT